MACYHPSEVLVRPKGAPKHVLNPTTVPCGSCIGCRADQARDWAVRIMHESQVRQSAWFVTLTYDEDQIPENGSLNPEDVRLFHRRMRKRYKDFSYYTVGEYGDENHRPHYHSVLFGPRFLDRHKHTDRSGAPVWTSEALAEAWPHGIHEFTACTYAAARYTAGYIRKKLSKTQHPDAYLRYDRTTGELFEIEQEFSRISTRPAVGRTFIEKHWRDIYPRDFVVNDGVPMKPPRYYDKYMDLPDEKGGCAERRQIMNEVRDQRWKDLVEISDEKLIMKEKIHRARTKLFNPRNKL